MQRFKNILFVVGEKTRSGGALQRAAELARRNEGRLTLVRALRFPWSAPGVSPIADFEVELEDLSVADWNRRLRRLAAPISRQSVQVETAVLTGRPFLQIIRHVLKGGHDLVVIEAESRTIAGMFFGTTSMHLIRKCPCPVWVMRPARRKRFRRVLAAVDTNPYESVRPKIAQTIVELAVSQARLDGAELHVVHVWDVTLSHLLRRPSGMSDRRRLAYTRKIRDAHREALQNLIDRIDTSDLQVRVHLRKGNAGHVIPRLAARERVEHLVLGSVRRVGVPGLFIGSTAERVLQSVRCSVLAVKPEGFVSPVQPD